MEGASEILHLDKKPGRTAFINGKEYLFYSGYNYLGINSEPKFLELILEGTDKYGWLFPSSRISNTRLALYEECEALLSTITGSDDTVLLPSGFTAGRVATSYHEAAVQNAPGSHPAILQQTSKFSSFNEWDAWLVSQDENLPRIIASDSVNPFTPAIHNFSFLKRLHQPLVVVIDDSHGVGIIGKDGCGVSSDIPRENHLEYLLTYSLSKAFGISGGAISCSKEWAKKFKSTSEYTSVTPLSPAQIYAFTRGQHIYQQQREKLLANILYFESRIKELPDIEHCKGFPVFTLPSFIDESIFYKEGIIISSFSYPKPNGEKLKRIVLNALHTQSDLDVLYLVLQSAYSASVSGSTNNFKL